MTAIPASIADIADRCPSELVYIHSRFFLTAFGSKSAAKDHRFAPPQAFAVEWRLTSDLPVFNRPLWDAFERTNIAF
jgi:hypothetical protein